VERIGKADAQAGLILDGFPRTLAQAEALDKALEAAGRRVDLAVNIAVPDEELVKRLSGRWMCRNCGAIYNVATGKPDKCQRCGGDLYQRDDDKPETVRSRLEKQKPPPAMMAHYRLAKKLIDINGMQGVEKVTEQLMNVLREWQAA
jgi:adenylate kinase